MGRPPGLKKQILDKVKDLDRIGQSKHAAKQEERARAEREGIRWSVAKVEGIYSYRTKDAVIQAGMQYTDWLQSQEHIKPADRRYLDDAKKYVGEYLQGRINSGYSAWTIRSEASHLAKIFGCSSVDFGVDMPKREQKNKVKNTKKLEDFANKKHDFNWKKHNDLVTFNRATGARRSEILGTKTRPGISSKDIYQKGDKVLCRITGKGGKTRTVEVLSQYREDILRIAEERKEQGQLFVGRQYPVRTPSHLMRQEFARERYAYERDRLDREQPDRERNFYITRDGQVYDRDALAATSRQLGHERVDVVVNNYLERI